MSVGALIMWPYKAGGRSRRGSPKAGTTVLQMLLFQTEKHFRIRTFIVLDDHAAYMIGCLDVDECTAYHHSPCAHDCNNTESSYTCSCRHGFLLSSLDDASCYGEMFMV